MSIPLALCLQVPRFLPGLYWDEASTLSRVYNRKREKSVTLVYHPCAKFDRDQMHSNMSESGFGQLSVCSHTHSHIDGLVKPQ